MRWRSVRGPEDEEAPADEEEEVGRSKHLFSPVCQVDEAICDVAGIEAARSHGERSWPQGAAANLYRSELKRAKPSWYKNASRGFMLVTRT